MLSMLLKIALHIIIILIYIGFTGFVVNNFLCALLLSLEVAI